MPLNIRRELYGRMERTKQMKQETHSLFVHIPARSCLKSIKLRLGMVGSSEESAKGYASLWLTWRFLNRLRTAAKNRGSNRTTSMEIQHVHAGWPQKTQLICYNVLSCHITVTFLEDFLKFNDIGKEYVEQ